MPLLVADKVSYQINQLQILDQISFAVGQGEVVGIIGPNGAGKTTLLKCLLGHLNVSSGSIKLKQKPIEQYSTKALAQHFALVAQKTDSSFNLTVFDVVKMGLLPHKNLFSLDSDHDRNQVILALKKFDLQHLLTHSFNTLSGGEQQRVLLARALVQRAQILILDEPTNHLDIYYQHQILQQVSKLGVTVIMTVHDLNLAAQYCQRIIALDKGRVVADSTPKQVLTPALIKSVFKLNAQVIETSASAPQLLFSLPTDEQQHHINTEGSDVSC